MRQERSVEMINRYQNSGSAAIFWLLNGKSVQENDLRRFSARLSPSETRRLAHFTRTVRRRQFLLGRVLLRLAIANITGRASHHFSVLERHGEGPHLLFNDPSYPAPNFSLSHSGDWIACAVSTAAVLGLDIEVNLLDRDFDSICSLAFPKRERSWFAARPPYERSAAFYLLWCAREAFFKLQCNLGSTAEALPSIQADKHEDFCSAGMYSYQLPVGDLGLTGVVLSNRPLSGIQQVVLTGLGATSDLIT
jgi:4'-phosphopantetheinyl transferase